MVLVDTSVWVDHFRKQNARLVELLQREGVASHPFVLGELACGNLRNRKEIVALLHALPVVTKADDDEILFFIESKGLMGRGIGLVDTHLLASCHISSCALWTRDRRLQAVARDMGIAFG